MWELIGQYASVFFSSMIKFVFGPSLGKLYHLSIIESALLSAGGMVACVMLFTTFIGQRLHAWLQKKFFSKRKVFSKRSRMTVQIWTKFGLMGVAFLTPILFTPIGGAIIVNSFGENKKDIFIHMSVSALFWGFVISTVFSFVNI